MQLRASDTMLAYLDLYLNVKSYSIEKIYHLSCLEVGFFFYLK